MMRRPLSEYRVLGPITEKLNFNQSNSSDIEYTFLYAGPSIPSTLQAPDSVINSMINKVSRALEMEVGLNESQYEIFTESIVARELRQDGNMLVVKIMNTGFNDSEAVDASNTLKQNVNEISEDIADSAVYINDFFNDANAEQID